MLIGMLVASLLFTSCRKQGTENCDWNRVFERSQSRAVEIRPYLQLVWRRGEWKPERIIHLKKWKLSADHRVVLGRTEVFGRGTKLLASTAADGPALLQESMMSLLPGAGAELEQALEGAEFALELPTLPEGVDAKSLRKVRWAPVAESMEIAQVASIDFDVSDVAVEPWVENAAEAAYKDEHGLTSDLPFEAIHWSGDPKNRFNLVIMADGYTQQDMAEYKQYAADLVQGLLGGTAPYRDYADLINVVRVDTVSAERGAHCDDLKYSPRKNHFKSAFPIACLNAKLGTKFGDRFLYQLDAIKVLRESNTVKFEGVSLADKAYVLVDTPKFGGTTLLWGTQSKAATLATFSHELGHLIGGLADEYLQEGDPCNVFGLLMPNLSNQKSKASSVKWKQWILSDTPIPTPAEEVYADRIGLYQGAGGGCKKMAYKPHQNCRMRHSQSEFCSVCLEQMILSFYDRANPIQGAITREGARLDAPVALGARMRTRWYVDGNVVQETPTYQPFEGLSAGAHSVRLAVQEDSAPVRKNRCSLIFTKTAKF